MSKVTANFPPPPCLGSSWQRGDAGPGPQPSKLLPSPHTPSSQQRGPEPGALHRAHGHGAQCCLPQGSGGAECVMWDTGWVPHSGCLSPGQGTPCSVRELTRGQPQLCPERSCPWPLFQHDLPGETKITKTTQCLWKGRLVGSRVPGSLRKAVCLRSNSNPQDEIMPGPTGADRRKKRPLG
jgi:hypothetical protein